jgi:hypothetical protein
MQAFLGQVGHMWRINSAQPEGIDERLAISPAIVGNQVVVCRDQGAQVFAKLKIDWRAVVERADAEIGC